MFRLHSVSKADDGLSLSRYDQVPGTFGSCKRGRKLTDIIAFHSPIAVMPEGCLSTWMPSAKAKDSKHIELQSERDMPLGKLPTGTMKRSATTYIPAHKICVFESHSREWHPRTDGYAFLQALKRKCEQICHDFALMRIESHALNQQFSVHAEKYTSDQARFRHFDFTYLFYI